MRISLTAPKARFYDPELGRFMQTDPIGYGDGLNVYNYVGADPVNFVDPWGLSPLAPGQAQQYCEDKGAGVHTVFHDHDGSKVEDEGEEVYVIVCTALDDPIVASLAAVSDLADKVDAIGDEIVITGRRIANRVEGALNTPFVILHEIAFPAACATGSGDGPACTLAEQLAVEGARGSSRATRIMQGQINDPRYPEHIWGKFQYVHRRLNGRNITVHFWRNLQTGNEEGFKIKR